jgi:hypothetical protein
MFVIFMFPEVSFLNATIKYMEHPTTVNNMVFLDTRDDQTVNNEVAHFV